MEEKKVSKISLSTFFLILAIILIILMSIFLLKLYNEKTELTEKSVKQNEKMSDLQNRVDNLTSELNNISTSIGTENTTNQTNGNTTNSTSSNTTTNKETTSNIQPNLSTYIGLWGNSTSNDSLYVYNLDNNEIMFDLNINGKPIGFHTKATLNGNTASFVINDDNHSLNGKITLDNNKIMINITDSTFDNVTKGTITFSNYLGSQN
ncbi:MAG: hypothetical protein HFJ34_06790 [Clostridia bacterium]|nr:hypothetical protein [Clostridia bacterium]